MKKYYVLRDDEAMKIMPFTHFYNMDNVATNEMNENSRGRQDKNSGGMHGCREMSRVLGATGLVDFTMLQTGLVQYTAWKLWIFHFFRLQITETTLTETVDTTITFYNEVIAHYNLYHLNYSPP